MSKISKKLSAKLDKELNKYNLNRDTISDNLWEVFIDKRYVKTVEPYIPSKSFGMYSNALIKLTFPYSGDILHPYSESLYSYLMDKYEKRESVEFELLNPRYEKTVITFYKSEGEIISCSRAVPGIAFSHPDPLMTVVEVKLSEVKEIIYDVRKKKKKK